MPDTGADAVIDARQAHCWMLTGISIGWLTGLSATPVVAALLSALMGAAVATLGTLAARGEHADDQRTARAVLGVTMLSLGLAVGAPLGVTVRARGLLAPSVRSAASTETPMANAGALLSEERADVGDCNALHRDDAGLREVLRKSTDRQMRELASRVSSDGALREVVEVVCSVGP